MGLPRSVLGRDSRVEEPDKEDKRMVDCSGDICGVGLVALGSRSETELAEGIMVDIGRGSSSGFTEMEPKNKEGSGSPIKLWDKIYGLDELGELGLVPVKWV